MCRKVSAFINAHDERKYKNDKKNIFFDFMYFSCVFYKAHNSDVIVFYDSKRPKKKKRYFPKN